ncbi:MAG TPA: branched-chain amino acid ABC transporter permease, partial [Ramlibacter sp.]
RLFQLSMVFVYAIALFGLNLLTGYNGQISLGHGAFFAIGAYACAIFISSVGLPYWLAVPAAGLVCLVIGFLFGLPALKLEGIYLALATFALAICTPQILKHKSLSHWTGGSQGLTLDKPAVPIAGLSDDRWLYFFCLACAVVMFVLGSNLIRGKMGRALVAIRDQPVAAAAMGVHLPIYKATNFGISSAYAGVAGALAALVTQFIAPDSFNVYLSISFLVGIVIGGLASVPGAIIGAVFMQFVPNVAEDVSKSAPWLVYGVMLLLAAYLFPTGVYGLYKTVAGKLARRRKLP